MNHVTLIGLGGIGSLLAEPLARRLADTGCRELLLVDGDEYSRGNYDRQSIAHDDIGHNKACAQSERLRSLFPSLQIRGLPRYIGRDNLGEIVRDDGAVLLCVDNHATRKLVSDRVSRLRDVLLISAGNELSDGNVQVYWRKAGRNLSPSLDAVHEEIRFPTDENPADLSCEELAQLPGGRQIVATNFMAAALMLAAFHAALTGRLTWNEVYFDVHSCKTNPLTRC